MNRWLEKSNSTRKLREKPDIFSDQPCSSDPRIKVEFGRAAFEVGKLLKIKRVPGNVADYDARKPPATLRGSGLASQNLPAAIFFAYQR
jgi:hypothetical protein